MNLTNDQRSAMACFTAFLLSDEKFMVLIGPAGVGKTFVLKEMLATVKNPNSIHTLMGGSPIKSIAVTATTNKAAEVLGKALTGVKFIDEVGTIHSFMKLTLKNDFETGQTKLVRGRDFGIIRDTLIVIDECSMIDRALLKILKESTVNCKFLFMGDRFQLASVFEDESEVFSLPGSQTEMREVVRNRGVPALGQICTQLREMVRTGEFTPIIPDGADIVLLNPDEMQAQLQEHFVKQEGASCRILAYSNNRVQLYNAYIRESLGLPPTYQTGETLICNNVVSCGNKQSTRIEQMVKVLSAGTAKPDELFAGYGWDIPVYKLDTTAGTLLQPVDYAQVSWALKQLSARKDWQAYFRVKETYADLRMPQAATVYKSQGSTYDTVFIDLEDIGKCTNASQAARMLYVAFSRAAKKIYLYGELPTRFQGIAA